MNTKKYSLSYFKNIDNKNTGKYREVNVRISGANHIPPDSMEISSKMEDFIK